MVARVLLPKMLQKSIQRIVISFLYRQDYIYIWLLHFSRDSAMLKLKLKLKCNSCYNLPISFSRSTYLYFLLQSSRFIVISDCQKFKKPKHWSQQNEKYCIRESTLIIKTIFICSSGKCRNIWKKYWNNQYILVRFLPLVIDHNHGYKSLPR